MISKKTALIITAVAIAVAACNQQKGSKAVDKVEDTVSKPVGQTSAAVMGANMVSAYVPNAARGDLYEIQAAEIALERSKNPQVKQLAEMIGTDHSDALSRLKTAVGSDAPDTAVPSELDDRRKGLIDNLRSAAPGDFDKVYADQQVAAHEEAITLHRGFGDNKDAYALAGHARTVLPKIEAHLQSARQLQGELG